MGLISLKADFAAKELFAHEKVRKQFLSDTLGIPPEDIKSVREEYHAVYRLRDSEGRDLTDLWELHIIELTKALKGTPLDDWIRLFNAESEEELDMITTKNEGITEAINVLKSMSLRRPFKAFFDDYMKAKRDRWDEDEYIRDEGRSEGIAIGEERGITIGEARGRSTDILTLLEQKGTVPADLRERILSQKDEAVLKQWLLAAASAGDIENFREKTGIM